MKTFSTRTMTKSKFSVPQKICAVLVLWGLLISVTLFSILLSTISSHTKGDVRTKRDLEASDELIFKRGIHKVSWSAAQKELKSVLDDASNQDVFISVKTSKKFHSSRLKVILETWYKLAPQKVWFFSDSEDASNLRGLKNGHLINTKCPSSHNRSALCCKMASEIMAFMESSEKWFCHFDDDNYVNLPALVRTLQRFNVNREWYIGKTSIQNPLEVMNKGSLSRNKKIQFRFATGGAGFCMSRPLAERMAPLIENGELVATCENIRLPDDVTVGYIAEHMLGVPLTVVPEFHSHLEPLRLIPVDSLKDQISLSYGKYETGIGDDREESFNLIDIVGHSQVDDPTRFLSIHCHLFPHHCRKEP